MALEVILYFPYNTSKNGCTLPHVYWMGQEGKCTLLIAFHSSVLFCGGYHHWLETMTSIRKEGSLLQFIRVTLRSLLLLAISDHTERTEKLFKELSQVI